MQEIIVEKSNKYVTKRERERETTMYVDMAIGKIKWLTKEQDKTLISKCIRDL